MKKKRLNLKKNDDMNKKKNQKGRKEDIRI